MIKYGWCKVYSEKLHMLPTHTLPVFGLFPRRGWLQPYFWKVDALNLGTIIFNRGFCQPDAHDASVLSFLVCKMSERKPILIMTPFTSESVLILYGSVHSQAFPLRCWRTIIFFVCLYLKFQQWNVFPILSWDEETQQRNQSVSTASVLVLK